MNIERVSKILTGIMLAIFLLLLSLSVLLRVFDPAHMSYPVAFIAAAFIFALWTGLQKRIKFSFAKRLGALKTGIILSTAFLVINLAYVFCVRIEPAGDYATFWKTAVLLSNSEPLDNAAYVAMFPHILGYSAFLSLFLRLFGEVSLAAPVLNVALGCISGIIIYYLCCKRINVRAAAFAYSLWILCPSGIMYNAMVLSEPYYTCLLMCFVLLVFLLEEKAGRGKIRVYGLMALPAALLLQGINSARPIAAIPIIAFFIWLIFLRGEKLRDKSMWKNWLVFALLLIVFYGFAGTLWKNYAEEKLGENLPDSPGYSIYVGFNTETGGSYSDSDMQRLQDYRFNVCENAEQAQEKMTEEAKERIKNIEPKALPGLFAAKLRTLLGDDQGGAFYTFEDSDSPLYPLCTIVSNIFYYFLLMLVFAGTVKMWKTSERSFLITAPLYVIGLTLAHMLVEVAARYHYSIIPMIIITAAFSFSSFRREKIKGE